MNFYHPEYRKFSLGKVLMLLKVEHARALGYQYYYPGYLVHNYPKFDYKLFPCLAATEVFDCLTSRWLPFSWREVDRQATELLADWEEEDFAPDGEA
jgi:arginine-tRNA-protein transferase